MNRIYNKLMMSVKGLRVLAVALVAGLAGNASAQLSGSYTIDGGTATGGTNYQTWSAFATAISAGVSGPVSVTVVTDITETVTVNFPFVNGTSATNTVSINGNGKILTLVTSTTNREVIHLSGADWFTFRNLTVRNAATTTFVGACIRFSNSSDNNSIIGCTLEYTGTTTGSTAGGAYISFSSSATSYGTGGASSVNGYNTMIVNNLMRTTNTNSPGPTYGINHVQASSNYTTTADNNTIRGNTIQNFYYYGIYTAYANGTVIASNNISRANATSNNTFSTLYGIYTQLVYSTLRSPRVDSNFIHDLPYVGSTPGTSNSTTHVMFHSNVVGVSARPFSIAWNTVQNITSSSTMYLDNNTSSQWLVHTRNTFDNCDNNSGGTGYLYGLYVRSGTEHRITFNTVKNCNSAFYFYGIYNNSVSTSTFNELSDNTVENNTSGYYGYCMWAGSGSFDVSRNKIINNTNQGGYGSGYLYVLYTSNVYNIRINSNLISKNWGQYGTFHLMCQSFSSGSYTAEIRQNTVHVDNASNPYYYHYNYALYEYFYYHPDVRVSGNIINIINTYYVYPIYTYNVAASAYKEWNYNSYYLNNIYGGQYWYTPMGQGSTFSAYNAIGFAGTSEYYGDPLFINVGANDYRSNNFANQNSTPTYPNNPMDVNRNTRNIIMSDRGAQESYMDLQLVSTDFSAPAQVCAGYSQTPTLTVKNFFVDTAMNFNVAYNVNGGPKTTVKFTNSILTGATGTVTFPQIQFNQSGQKRVVFFIDIPDDNRTNDSIVYNFFVKPAPGGGVFTAASDPTTALYQYGKAFDVTQVNVPVYYNVNAPRAYNNATYNTNWNATAYATLMNGTLITGASIITTPSGSTDLKIKFVTSDVNLEDSFVWVNLKVNDLNNGCDTVIRRKVLIYPTVKPLFTYPAKICDGDAVAFTNKSTVKSGSIEFMWDFGTGVPADASEAPEPVFIFPGPGTYKVMMVTKTVPYGFVAKDSHTIVVNQIPVVKFSKLNACQGKALVFTNLTTPATGTTYVWNFGDNTTSTATNPSKTYTNTGSYNVTLSANLNGCIATMTQKAYQFDKPVATFALVSGTCDNQSFEFKNNSTILNGNFGTLWNFDDNGVVSTEDNASHQFSSPGTHNVKLVATSEFGCQDSMTKAIVVKESPKSSFTYNSACSVDPTTFTNTTPDVMGAIANYAWNFGDGGTSTLKNPVHAWAGLGPKTVTMKVTLDNGCSQSTTSTLNVGIQPVANFVVANTCAGDPAVFDNTTTWPQGDITYDWKFGDNNSSGNSDPTHKYQTLVTKTYNVTLTAAIAGGCSSSITKQITVNESPKTCDFTYSPDYAFGFYGMDFKPLDGQGNPGGQSDVEYTWVYGFEGTKTTTSNEASQHDWQGDGSYQVTMRARVKSTGCECTVTKTVVMSRSNAQQLAAIGATVYPNPTSGVINIALTKNFGEKVTVELRSMSGAIVKTITAMNNGLLTINGTDVASGMYIVHVVSGEKSATARINIQH